MKGEQHILSKLRSYTDAHCSFPNTSIRGFQISQTWCQSVKMYFIFLDIKKQSQWMRADQRRPDTKTSILQNLMLPEAEILSMIRSDH